MSLSVDTTRFTVDAGRVFGSATVVWAAGLRPVSAPPPPATVQGGT